MMINRFQTCMRIENDEGLNNVDVENEFSFLNMCIAF